MLDLHPGDVLTVAPNNWVRVVDAGQPVIVLTVINTINNYSEVLLPDGHLIRAHVTDSIHANGGLPIISKRKTK